MQLQARPLPCPWGEASASSVVVPEVFRHGAGVRKGLRQWIAPCGRLDFRTDRQGSNHLGVMGAKQSPMRLAYQPSIVG